MLSFSLCLFLFLICMAYHKEICFLYYFDLNHDAESEICQAMKSAFWFCSGCAFTLSMAINLISCSSPLGALNPSYNGGLLGMLGGSRITR